MDFDTWRENNQTIEDDIYMCQDCGTIDSHNNGTLCVECNGGDISTLAHTDELDNWLIEQYEAEISGLADKAYDEWKDR